MDIKTLRLKLAYDNSEALQELYDKAARINIKDAKFELKNAFKRYSFSPLNKVIPKEYIEEGAALILAQALLQVLFISPAGGCIRDMMPSKDFLDKFGRNYPTDEWRVPYDGEYRYVRERNYTYPAFHTGINSRYTMKVMILLGFCNTDKDNKVYTHSISINRGNVRCIEIVNTQLLETHPVLLLSSPILIAAADEIRINYNLKKDAEGAHDTIAPVGLVAESIGCSMTG